MESVIFLKDIVLLQMLTRSHPISAKIKAGTTVHPILVTVHWNVNILIWIPAKILRI